MDKSIFKNVLKYYADAQSLEEFAIRLDLIDWTLNDFNSMYLENIVSVCPKFFKILRRLKDNEHFDVIEFTNSTNWIIKAPIKVKFENNTLTISRPNGESIRTCNAQIDNKLSNFDLDPVYETCSILMYELYEAYYGKI